MRRLLLCSALLASSVSFSVSAEQNYINFNFYADYIKMPNSERYDFVVNLIKENESNVVKITEGGSSFYMPMNAFLVLQNHTDHAFELVKDGHAKAFDIFPFNDDNSPSDMVFAIDMGKEDYVRKAINYVDDVDKRFTYNGEKGYTLLMAAATNNRSGTHAITRMLLDSGANQYSVSYNDMTALSIAQSRRNSYFINALTAHNEKVSSSGEADLLSNSPRSGRLRLEDSRIVENLKNYMLEDIMSGDNPHEDVFRLILNGYTNSAIMLIDAMVEEGVFNPEYVDENGFSLITSTSLSAIVGGDVEVAQKLIALGANVDNTTIDNHTEGEVALLKDAFKVLFVLVLNGFDPFSENSSSDGVDLLTLTVATDPVPINSLNMLTLIYEDMIESSNN